MAHESQTKTYVIVIITGASERSIGQYTALALARGSPKQLILLSRTESKVIPVMKQIVAIDSNISVRFIRLDLASQDSVRAVAAEILKTVSHIDALFNNAAVMGIPYALTPEGIEMQFGVNHIGHFLLTNLLVPKMGRGSRVVCVSSAGHSMSGIRFEDVNFKNGKEYDTWESYGQSKSANILFAMELAWRLKNKGIQSFSLHPANTGDGTQLASHLDNPDWPEIMKKFNGQYSPLQACFAGIMLMIIIGYPVPIDKTMPQSCATSIAAAIDPTLESKLIPSNLLKSSLLTIGSGYSGAYLDDCKATNAAPCARSPTDAAKLWVLSELLVGERFQWRE